jgi:hypothetical protein
MRTRSLHWPPPDPWPGAKAANGSAAPGPPPPVHRRSRSTLFPQSSRDPRLPRHQTDRQTHTHRHSTQPASLSCVPPSLHQPHVALDATRRGVTSFERESVGLPVSPRPLSRSLPSKPSVDASQLRRPPDRRSSSSSSSSSTQEPPVARALARRIRGRRAPAPPALLRAQAPGRRPRPQHGPPRPPQEPRRRRRCAHRHRHQGPRGE